MATLTIDKTKQTLTFDDVTFSYDGNPHKLKDATTDAIGGAEIKYSTDNGISYTLDSPPEYKEVGSYNVRVRAENVNYDAVYGIATLKIERADQALIFNSDIITYDGKSHKLENATTNAVGARIKYSIDDGVSYTLDNPPLYTDAGVYRLMVRSESDGYMTKTALATLTINKAGQTITFIGDTLPYDGKSHKLAPATTDAIGGGDIKYSVDGGVSYTLDNPPIYTEAGVYNIRARSENVNYLTADAMATLTINKAEQTLIFNSDTIAYDGKSHKLENAITNAPGARIKYSTDDGVNYNLDNPPLYTEAGVYRIMARSESDSYITKTALAVLTIEKADQIITFNDATFVYDGNSHGLAPATTNAIGGGNIKYSVDGGQTYTLDNPPLYTEAGVYNVRVRSENVNYDTKEAIATLTISKAKQTLTFISDTFFYNGNSHRLAPATTDAIGGGDIKYSVDGGQTYTLDNPPLYTEAGVYNIRVRSENVNYLTKEAVATLKIERAEQTITFNDAKFVYDGNLHGLVSATTDAIGGADIKYSTDDGISYTLDSPPLYKDVGTYKVMARAVSSGYITKTALATLTINKAEQTITFRGDILTYDGNSHKLDDATTNAIGGGDIKYSVDNGVSYTLDSPPLYTDAGIYNIRVRSENVNYTTAEAMAVLTINKAEQKVIFTDKTVNFDNYEHELDSATTDAIGGATISYTTDGSFYSPTMPAFISIGEHKVTARVENKNYLTKEAIARLEIIKGIQTLTFDDMAVVFDNEEHGLTPAATNATGSAMTTISYTTDGSTYVSYVPSYKDVGVYTLTALSENDNYNPTSKTAVLEVTPSEQALVFEDRAVFFDNYEHGLTPAATNATGSAVTTISYTTDGSTYVSYVPEYIVPGSYKVTARAVNANYLTKEAMATLTINKAEQKVTFDNKTVNFDNYEHALNPATTNTTGSAATIISYTTDGSTYVNDVPSYKEIGIYKVTAMAVNANYITGYAMAELEIIKGIQTLTFNDRDVPFDNYEHGLTPAATNATGSAATIISYTTDGSTYVNDVPSYKEIGIYKVTVMAVNANYITAYAMATLEITKGIQTLIFDDMVVSFDNKEHELTPAATNATGPAATTISYTTDGSTYSFSVPAFINAGEHKVTAMAVNENYLTKEAMATLTINKAEQMLIFNNKTADFDNKEHLLDAATSEAIGDTEIMYAVDGINYSYSMPGFTDAGSHQVKARAVNDNYDTTYAVATLTINPIAQTLEFESKSVTYDGKAHSLDPATTTAIGGAEITYTADGSFYSSTMPNFINVGSYQVTARAMNKNYIIEEKMATLTIAAKKPTPKIVGNIVGIPKEDIFKYKASGKNDTMKVSMLTQNSEVTWEVSPESHATVSKTGSNTATVAFKNKEGWVTIRARLKESPNIYKEVKVKLVKNVTKIRTALKKYYISKGKSFTIPVVLDDNTDKLLLGGVKSKLTWKSSNPKVLKVNSKGKIKAAKKIKKKKKVTITVTAASGIKKKIIVYVVPKVKKLESISFRFLNSYFEKRIKFVSVKLHPSDATNLKVKFKSSKSSGLYIDKAGFVFTRKKGRYTVTTKIGSKKKARTYNAKHISR
jgi:hypothetical protein